MAIRKPKQCKAAGCDESFIPSTSFHVACSPGCALEVARSKREKKENAERRRETRERRERLETVSDHIKKTQDAVNAYIRERDRGKCCVSCGTPLIQRSNLRGGNYDAGHYRSRGGNSTHLRFNFLNIWGQCKNCNRDKSGNIVEYRKELIRRIGEDRVVRLEYDNTPRSFDIPYLKRLASICKRRRKNLIRFRLVD